jgi:hypothetical protein
MRRAGILAIALALLIAATAGGAAAALEKVYFEKPFGMGHLSYKPKRIDFKDAQLTKLRWHRWNHKAAWGHGRARINTCDPICATGPIVHGRVHLKMFRRHRVDGKLVYGCMKGTARAEGRRYPIQWGDRCPY